MSLSPAQVQIIVNTEPFRSQLRELVAAILPLAWRISLIKQRRRSRIVTRQKQRRNW